MMITLPIGTRNTAVSAPIRRPWDVTNHVRHFVNRIAGFILAIVVTFAGTTAFAQVKTLEIELSGMQPPVQVGRPILTWWDVKIHGSALVEGRVELRIRNNANLLATVTTEDLALTGPQQRIRVMLPPITDENTVEQLQLDVAFRGPRVNQDLGRHILRVALSKSRTFMVLTAASRLAPKRSAEREQISRRLAFESLILNLDDTVKTVPVALEPSDLPQEPMAYCAYEMVILFGNEFRLLKKPQLDAILAWVRAGGSVYLEPTGILEPYHVEFLRSLTAFGPPDLVIQPDSNGRLIPGTIWNDERLMRMTNGLGRVVLRVDDEQSEGSVETPAWREAVAFLWKIHADQAAMITEKPSTTLNSILPKQPETPNSPYAGLHPAIAGGRLSLPLITSTAELLDWLMPDGVRMVPLWVLGLILCSFVVWIGPVDYFVLGYLKARKYTWLTFPLATLLVTGLTVWITNRYMATSETRRGLVLHDIGDDGSIVRTSRFELLFIASTRAVTTDVQRGVFAPLDGDTSIGYDQYQQAMMPGRRRNYGTAYRNSEKLDQSRPRLSGRIPTQFSVTQDLAKWTPQLNRMFWIPAKSDKPVVDWTSLSQGILDDPAVFQNRTIAGTPVSRIHQQFGPQSLVACLGPQGRWALNQQGNWWSQNSNDPSIRIHAARGYNDYQVSLPGDVQGQPALFRWLYQHSVAAPYGLFSVTSQIGPTGGADLNDLPILDGSDPSQGLLIVVVPSGDDFIVYRKRLKIAN